jgi:hypothetical protein
VLEVGLASVGTFALARTIGCRRLAALYCALAYSFCPLVLWYLELQIGPGFVLAPAILWVFARLALSPSSNNAVIAGVGAGVMILSAHPEVAFFGIIFACLLAMMLCEKRLQMLRLLALAALCALCVCAPVLFPFLEFLRNSDCYKYGLSQSAFAAWQGLTYNILSPGFGGASPFLGVLVFPFVPFAFANGSRKTAVGLATVSAVAFTLAVKLWPVSILLAQPPFNYVITVYCLPLFLLTFSLLSALGIQQFIGLMERKDETSRHVLWMLMALLAVAVLVPLMLHVFHAPLASGNFDMTLPDMSVDRHAWRRDAIIAVLAGAAVSISRRGLPTRVALVALVVLNTVSVINTARASLTPQPSFDAPSVAPVRFLYERGERMVAVGDHLCKPNINMMYPLDDVRSRNVMWPKGYLKLMQASGAHVDEYRQIFSARMSPVLDVCSVKYVLSQIPVTGTADSEPASTPLSGLSAGKTISLFDRVTINGGSIWADATNHQACGFLSWRTSAPPESGKDRTIMFVLTNSQGQNVVWFGDRERLVDLLSVGDGSARGVMHFAVPLPDSGSAGLELHLKTFDGTAEKSDSLLTVIPLPQSMPHQQYALRGQFENNIRIYENTKSMPRAYIAGSAQFAHNQEEAIRMIAQAGFEPRTAVVLDGSSDSAAAASSVEADPGVEPDQSLSAADQKAASPASGQVSLTRSPGRTEISYSSKTSGYLVLTDTFYPGWKAYIDSKPAEILRANVLFRCLKVPAGSHRVVFLYQPLSFAAGVGLFCLFCLTIAGVACWRRRRAPTEINT